jgi:hypothetical protein
MISVRMSLPSPINFFLSESFFPGDDAAELARMIVPTCQLAWNMNVEAMGRLSRSWPTGKNHRLSGSLSICMRCHGRRFICAG